MKSYSIYTVGYPFTGTQIFNPPCSFLLQAHDGIDPLLSAVEQGHKEIVELLIDNGAKVNTRQAQLSNFAEFLASFGRDKTLQHVTMQAHLRICFQGIFLIFWLENDDNCSYGIVGKDNIK